MARRRFFVDRVSDGHAEITGENAHHLARVLRVEPGQKYEISSGEEAWLATVATVRKNLVEFTDLEALPSLPPRAPVTLFLSLIKFENFEWAVEKATELGVTAIVPVEAARSERGLLDGARKRVERWRRIAREAGEQSRRLSAPRVEDPIQLRAVPEQTFTHRVWLDEEPGAPMLIAAFARQPNGSTALAIGPEGGWAPAERDLFTTAGWTAASLGPSILRAETAVCAALAVLAQMP